MKKKLTQYTLTVLAALYPFLLEAQGIWTTNRCQGDNCGWINLISLVQDAIKFMLLIALPISAVVFAIGGFKIMTSGENAGARSEAKKMMGKVAMGLILMLAAGLIVNTILKGLDVPSDYVLIEETQ